MPFIARSDGRAVIPEDVDDREDVYCTTCDGLMRTRGPFTDGRSRHFYHINDIGGGCSGPGPDTDPGPAESELHQKLKASAVSGLREWKPDYKRCGPEIVVDATSTETDVNKRRADVLLEFSEQNQFFGRGLIVEVQHLNAGKDIRATTHDYLLENYSVYWATVDDFDDGEFDIGAMEHAFEERTDASFASYCDSPPKLESPEPLISPNGSGRYTTRDPAPECDHELVHNVRDAEKCVRCGMELERCYYNKQLDQLRPIDEVFMSHNHDTVLAADRESVERPLSLKKVDVNGDPPDHDHRWRGKLERFSVTKHVCSECNSVMVVSSDEIVIQHTENNGGGEPSWNHGDPPWE